jgi:sugar phosphate isomerase/epimerase
MITKALFKKTVALSVTTLFLGVLFSVVSVYAADKPIVLGKYPMLKFGFTTQNLAKWLPNSVDNLKTVIDFAKKKGFAFIELRDANASLSYDDAKKIAAYAKKKKIEVIYAMGQGALDNNYFELFAKGLANTMLFDGPRFARTAAFGKEFAADPKKQFWTAAEFSQLVQNLNKAGNTAAMFGYTLFVENAFEGVKGDGADTFGMADLLGPKGVNSNVGFQLDTANFFCTSRAENSPGDVKAFFEENVKRMGYSHLKTSIDKKAGQVLNGNEVPFETFFTSLAKNGKVYVAIELANADTLENAKINHEKSIDYLRKNF